MHFERSTQRVRHALAATNASGEVEGASILLFSHEGLCSSVETVGPSRFDDRLQPVGGQVVDVFGSRLGVGGPAWRCHGVTLGVVQELLVSARGLANTAVS